MNEEDSEKQRQPDSATSETPMTSRADHVPPVVESIQGAGDQASTRRAGQDHQEEFGDGSKPSQTNPSVESNGMLSPVNILDRLLAPQSLQWLMAVGGGMMVLGLIILLWINDFFTPVITACALASANLCVLGVGFSLLRFSKQQLVGQALTLARLLNHAHQPVVLQCQWFDHDRRPSMVARIGDVCDLCCGSGNAEG